MTEPCRNAFSAGALKRCAAVASVWLAACLTAAGISAAAEEAVVLSGEEHVAWTAIGRVNVGGLDTRGTCTGTLIAPDLVLTAAHCVPQRALRAEAPETVHFVAGWYRDEYAAHRTGRAFHIHPDYVRGRHDGRSLYSDIALIVLDEPIPPEDVEPLPLGEMPSFADDVEIIAYSNRRSGALSRAGPCTAISLDADTLGLTCSVRGGNSGAPVLRRGENGWELVAVAVARNTDEGGFQSFAARPSDLILQLAGRDAP